ncbi:MAG: tRNA dihydrouridine synthase DusB [Candidatus Omnitrophica bacterium]|nr:tRNA dihydrouridine synthase DusB [Candidatus Omnitrophota bacterium]
MIRLKDLVFQTPLIQAPMAGCPDLAFRTVARRFGMEMAYPEMISAESLIRANPKTLDFMKTHAGDRPLGCQLFGARPESVAEAARMAEAMGFDAVDINMGCPVPKVTGPGAGSALMKDPRRAARMIRQTARVLRKIPLTVKMRTGFADATGKEALELARIASGAGAAAVAVHARTKTQGYSGKADWNVIRLVKKKVRIPVFGNGDVFLPADARRMMRETGCDAVMIGRGSLGNPWIYARALAAMRRRRIPPPPELKERKKIFLEHFALLTDSEGEKRALLKIRTVAAWYFRGFPRAAELRQRMNRVRSARAVTRWVEEFNPT